MFRDRQRLFDGACAAAIFCLATVPHAMPTKAATPFSELQQQIDTLRLYPENAGKGFGELQALLVKDGLAAKYVDALYPGTLSNEEVRRPSCRH